MLHRRIIAAIAAAWLLALAPVGAQAASTIDPTVPAQNAPLNSEPIRNNFIAAFNDVNHILNMYAGAVAPTNPYLFEFWGDTSTNPYTVRQYDGAVWTAIGTLNPSTHTFVPGFGTIPANTVIAGPSSGSPANAAARALVGADLPLPAASTLGGVQSAAAVSHQWINSISTLGVPALSQPSYADISGTLPAAACPNPSASTLGCTESIAVVSHNFLTGISTSGVPSQVQPAFTDISGSVAAAQLPNPTASTLGGIESYVGVSHQWLNAISTSGVPGSTQPACTDLSGVAASCSTDTTNAGNISSGLLGVAQGGTHLASGTSGGILGYTASGTLASSAALPANALVLGGGAGATPTALGSLGTATTLLHGNVGGAPSFAAVSLTADISGTLGLGNGGSGQATAAAARASSGFDIDQATTHGDSIYTILATDRTVITSASLTAPRTWTLPAANAVNPGQEVDVMDAAGGVGVTNTLTLARAGADTVNGGTSAVINSQYGGLRLKSDGVSAWTFVPQAAGAGSGTVTSVTCGSGLSGGTFTVSGTCAISAPVSVPNGGSGATTLTGVLHGNGASAFTAAAVSLTADVSGILPSANGGSGVASPTAHSLMVAEGASAFTLLGAATAGRMLLDQGAAADPSFNAMSGDATISSAGALTIGAGKVTYADVATAALATAANFQANAASVVLPASSVWSAAALTALTDAATIATDMSTGFNFSVTLGGNRTLGNPTNTKVGQTGCYYISQDGTGSRTLAYGSSFKFAGGTAPVLTTTASALDVFCYQVETSTFILASLTANVK